MSEPYRPLFVELGEDLLAIARGIFEAAVTPPPREPGRSVSRTAMMIASFSGGPALKYLLMQFDASAAHVEREASRAAIRVVLRWSCRHVAAASVPERVIEMASAGDRYDSFIQAIAQQIDGRPCSCMVLELLL